MGNYKQRRRRRLVKGPSIIRVFGSAYKLKEEANKERKSRRDGQPKCKTSKLQISTKCSVRAISTPFGGLNK